MEINIEEKNGEQGKGYVWGRVGDGEKDDREERGRDGRRIIIKKEEKQIEDVEEDECEA